MARDIEKRKEYQKQYYAKTRLSRIEYMKKYQQKFPEGMWRRTIKSRYGVTEEQYNRMAKAQGGVCAICGTVPTKRFSIDHNHVTKQVRGLLCNKCNMGLGYFKDSISSLEAAAKYLKGDGSWQI